LIACTLFLALLAIGPLEGKNNQAPIPSNVTPQAPKSTGILVAVEPEPINDEDRKWLAKLLGKKDPDNWRPSLADLPNEAVLITVKSFDRSGNVSYITAGAATKNSTYEVTQDYMKYVSVRETYNDGSPPRIARYGISLRVRANVVAKSGKFDLGGLLPLGIAANKNQASGTLSVEVAGIQSRDVTNVLPLPAQLSQESVIAAIQASATIKSRIYDGFEGQQSTDQTGQTGIRTQITIQRIAEEKLSSELEQKAPGVFQIIKSYYKRP